MFIQFDHSEMIAFPTPTGSLPDEMLPFLATPAPETHQATTNLDILLSKLLNDGLNDIELQQLNEQQRMVLENVKLRNKAKKRPDEYQKHFFKRAFKYAEKEYFGKSKNKSRKMSAFYHHHFETIAQKMNVPLVNFYHPDKKTKPGLRTGQKSFNLAYIKLLLRSNSFREVSKAYYQQFKSECIAERKIKIPKFVNYIKTVMAKHGHNPEKMRELIKSSKCKVPWTNSEIEEADKRAIAELESGSFLHNQKGGDEQEQMQDEEEEVYSEMSCERSSEE